MTIERSVTILEHIGSTLHGQRFAHEDGYEPGRVVELPQRIWEEFGRPDTITVVFYPGDALNDIDHPAFTTL